MVPSDQDDEQQQPSTLPAARFAVIDLGTNTFHLLIAEPDNNGQFTEVLRVRHFVKLAEEGIARIGDAPYRRGLATLRSFRQSLDEHGVQAVAAIGTAALRTATNGPAFVQAAATEANIDIQLISGDTEARLIYEGVKLALPTLPENILIMDIGGGSVEFILANRTKVHWAQSFPIGVAVLYRQFHRQDPISLEEVQSLHDFLTEALQPLQAQLHQFPATHLVGAAGTFDVIAKSLGRSDTYPYIEVDAKQFPVLYQRLVTATQAARRAMPDVPLDRVDMIVVAMILIDRVLNLAAIERISVSAYSMKEGMLQRLITTEH